MQRALKAVFMALCSLGVSALFSYLTANSFSRGYVLVGKGNAIVYTQADSPLMFYIFLLVQFIAAVFGLLGAACFAYMLFVKHEKLDGLLLDADRTVFHVRPGVRWIGAAVGILVGMAVVASIAGKL